MLGNISWRQSHHESITAMVTFCAADGFGEPSTEEAAGWESREAGINITEVHAHVRIEKVYLERRNRNCRIELREGPLFDE